MTYSEYSFPNDLHIFWSLMIVTYPYITGLIAGAFVASALSHVFGRKELAPVNRLALLVSLSFMVCATLPLLNHLGHPERALNIMITPNFRSAIAGFGYIYSFYLTVLLLEIWLTWRPEIVESYHKSSGMARLFWGSLALGVYEISGEARKLDERLIFGLAVIGLPAACTLHGYVGFLFGSLKSNPWWSTPLMPQVFLLSAVISGMGFLIIVYLGLCWNGYMKWSFPCVRSLTFFLWLFLVLYVVSEGLELLFFFYESSDAWYAISQLILTRIWVSFVVLQIGIGVLIPMILLTVLMLVHVKESTYYIVSFISSVVILFEVWLMRWNIVIGGQQFSKSYVGFRDYDPLWLEKEGILPAMALTLLPVLILFILTRLLSVHEPETHATHATHPAAEGED
ncbi:MAG: polysulfide reductase NrfD [Nitrospinota bacterium]|nr:polysulfide reductase NrfD [Nitrospinota bacterium]